MVILCIAKDLYEFITIFICRGINFILWSIFTLNFVNQLLSNNGGVSWRNMCSIYYKLEHCVNWFYCCCDQLLVWEASAQISISLSSNVLLVEKSYPWWQSQRVSNYGKDHSSAESYWQNIDLERCWRARPLLQSRAGHVSFLACSFLDSCDLRLAGRTSGKGTLKLVSASFEKLKFPHVKDADSIHLSMS